MREALLRAAEQAADPAFHGVLTGSAPAGRRLRLTKAFDTPTSQAGLVVKDKLDFTMVVPAGGVYRWHVNPSTRPIATAQESYTLTCEGADGTVLERRDVVVGRGATVPVDLRCGSVSSPTQPPTPAVNGRRLFIRTTTASARLANRVRRVGIRLQVTGGALTSVRVRLVRGKRTVASGRTSRLTGTRTLRLKLGRKVRLRSGTHRLTVTAMAGTRKVTATRTIRVKR